MKWREQLAESAQGSLGSGGFSRHNCPACLTRHHKEDTEQCISLNNTNGFFKCWRCGWKGRIGEHDDHDFEDVDDRPEDLETPSDYIPLAGGSMLTRPARQWLHKRGVIDSAMRGACLGYAYKGEHRGRVIMPIWDSEGTWIGWVGRSIIKGEPRPYHSARGMPRARLFYADQAATNAPPDPGPLIVTEGPMDALAHWPRAAACLGKPTADQVERLRGITRPGVVALDGDAWREGLALARSLRAAGRLWWSIALPPREDLGSLPHKSVSDAVRYAVENQTDVQLF